MEYWYKHFRCISCRYIQYTPKYLLKIYLEYYGNMINVCNRILSVIHIILETIKIEWTTRGQFLKLNFYIDQLIF